MQVASILFPVLFLVHFFVPGYCLLTLLGYRRHRFFLSLSLSYAIHNLLLIVSLWVDGPVLMFTVLNVATVVILCLFSLLPTRYFLPVMRATSTKIIISSIANKSNLKKLWRRKDIDVLLTCVVLIVPISLYLAYVGPYLEVPADIWAHLGVMQELFARHFVEHQPLNEEMKGFLLGHSQGTGSTLTKGLWYFTLPWFANLLGVRVETLIQPMSLVNSGIFLTGIYFFSLYVLHDLPMKRTTWLLASALSAVLCFLHFGVDVFSYVRYYVAAPSFLNFLIFLGTIVVFVDVIRNPVRPFLLLSLIVINLISMTLIHIQEALFTIVMLVGLSIFFVIGSQRKIGSTQSNLWSTGFNGLGIWPFGRILCWLILLTAVVLVFWSYFTLDWVVERKQPFVVPISKFLGIDVVIASSGVRILSNVFIANPGFRAYGAITLWGVIIYLIYSTRIRHFARSPLLTVGMLSPLLTIFNPIFVGFFLRFSPPEALWRFIFIVPLYAVGSLLIVTSIGQLVVARRIRERLGSLALLLVLAFSLFPFYSRYIEFDPPQPLVRIYSIHKVEENNSPKHWDDLFAFLRTLSTVREVLTDPVTGYLTRGFTQHRYYGAKFNTSPEGGYRDFDQNLEDDTIFDQYAGWLLIVNRRDGGPSRNGELSGHWMRDELKVSRYYSEKLFSHIRRNSDRFRILWQGEDITVYEIERL